MDARQDTYPGGLGMDTPNATFSPARSGIRSPTDQNAGPMVQHQRLHHRAGPLWHRGIGNFLSPGIEKVDLGLMKNFKISESSTLQMRAEAFNVFNHTNFVGPNGAGSGGIDTDLSDGTFGQAISAHMPRTMQFSGKLYF